MNKKPSLIEALADIKQLRHRVIERQHFCGYSGVARITGGVLTLIGATLLSMPEVAPTLRAHLIGWGIICGIAALINFIALIHWWRSRKVKLERLRPTLDIVAPLVVGGLFTATLIFHEQYYLLFSTWMWLFGVTNISSRHSLPKPMAYIGWYYIAAGVFMTLPLRETSFTNPWPMGIVFFVGELVGGIAFIRLRNSEQQ